MEVKEEKSIKEQQVREKMIPVFTVLKNGAILKNIFVVNSRDFSSPETSSVRNDDEVEEILLVGRHPDCDILLTHPSISRYHLEIRSVSSSQKLFVTDLSSVHGTWVTDQKVEPGTCVEVKEGDVIRIGGSTRIYKLHWIPLSRAYDIDNPFVSPPDASSATEEEEENIMLEVENLEVAHQSLANTESVDDGDLHLDVTSEGTGSSFPSEDDDTYITIKEISSPLASPSFLTLATDSVKMQKLKFNEDLQTSTKWNLDFVKAAAEKPSLSKQQRGGYPEVLGCSEFEVVAEADEYNVRGDGVLHLGIQSSVPSEDDDPYLAAMETSLLPLPSDSIETEKLQCQEDFQTSLELKIDIIEGNTENRSGSCSPSKGQIDGCFEASGCTAFEFAAEAEIPSVLQEVSGETEFFTKQVMEAFAEPVDNGYIEVSGKMIAVSPNSSPLAEQLLEILTEDDRGLLGSELHSDVSIGTDSENLDHKSNEVNPAGDQNEKRGVNRETEKIFNIGSSSCPSEDLEQSGTQSFLSLENLKPITEISIASERSEEFYNLSEIGDEGNTDKEVPCPSYYTKSQENQIQESRAHAVRDDALSEMDSSRSGKAASIPLLEASGCSAFELAAEVEILSLRQEVSGKTGFVMKQVMEASAKPLTKAEIQSHEYYGETEVSRPVTAVSPKSFPQTEPTLTGKSRSILGSEVATETDCENLHQKSNVETKISSRQANAVSDCLSTANERLSRINTEDIQSLCSSWQPHPESAVEAPSEIWSEVNPAGDQNQLSAVNRETAQMFDEGSSSCLSEDLKQSGTQCFMLTPNQKPKTEVSEESYSQENTDKEILSPSTLAAGTFEDTKPIKENQTPQMQAVRDDVLSEMDSSRRLSTCNIWSRRGKAASVLQIRTNKSEGKQKQIGNQPKSQLHRKQQALNDKSISLSVHHSAEKLEPEIFTPDKENLTPSSHMLKRLQEIGEIKDSKSSSKLSGRSCSSKIPSSIDIVTSGALTVPAIFTPDKENLTPNSHMRKRLQELGDIKDTKGSSYKATCKPDLHSMSSKTKVKHEPVAPKKKVERAHFQTLHEKSSSQSQSCTEDSLTASGRNNISRGIRSSSILSDRKQKMKWTIVLDTCSLLDKESRKPLHLLQGLKGTHLVVPRTVLRELNETKRISSFFFRRRTETALSALDWIEECKVNTKWWIQLQKPSEETKATAPTPSVTPHSNGSFSLHWNQNNKKIAPEIDSPTSEDQVLECALLYRHRNHNNDKKLVLLSNDATLKIKAMAEGVICETVHEFYESLVNPFSERFMWRESLPRGRTWSHLNDVVLREKYNNNNYNNGGRRGQSYAAAAATKGLKLILHHNSHYGQIQ